MLCLRCSRGLNAFSKLSIASASRTAHLITPLASSSKRTFTSLPSLRPTIIPSSLSFSLRPNPTTTTASSTTTDLDATAILPISTHPSMNSTQIRCAGRNTFNPSHFVRKRRHGFLARVKSRTGRMMLKRRRAKKRSTLSH
ncbi:50S ribosomal protein L34 [Lachnellula subtilissima]|uniref:50S ribosomal protein L34 n=1 Tax=Lachnellula subtilissima TaxID=602034 RepID=A0A8H8RI97_9HELO|nr:50S ribosomal protein L34 [Lachnellula subtilissima]